MSFSQQNNFSELSAAAAHVRCDNLNAVIICAFNSMLLDIKGLNRRKGGHEPLQIKPNRIVCGPGDYVTYFSSLLVARQLTAQPAARRNLLHKQMSGMI